MPKKPFPKQKGRGANEKPRVTIITCNKCGTKFAAGTTCPNNRSHP